MSIAIRAGGGRGACLATDEQRNSADCSVGTTAVASVCVTMHCALGEVVTALAAPLGYWGAGSVAFWGGAFVFRNFGFVLALIVPQLVTGCGGMEVFRVEVSGLNAGAPVMAKRYTLVPADREMRGDDLQFLEFGRYVDAALAKKGYVKAASPDQADIAIFLDYGIGAPQQHTYTYSVPQWGQTGVAASQTTGSVSVYGNQASYSAQTQYTPTYGITGHSTHVGSYTTHDRFVRLSAFDLRNSRTGAAARQLWSTSARSTGSSGDLRRVFPAMIVAVEPNLGENTGQNLRIEVSAADERLAKLRATSVPASTITASKSAKE